MKKNKFEIGILILAMLVSMALIPAVGAQQEDNFSEDEYYLPDYGPSIFADLEDDSDVIDIRGTMPEIKVDEEQWEWLQVINTSILRSEKEISPYMRANGGPLIGFGYSVNGYIFVEFDEKLRDSIDISTIDKLYSITQI